MSVRPAAHGVPSPPQDPFAAQMAIFQQQQQQQREAWNAATGTMLVEKSCHSLSSVLEVFGADTNDNTTPVVLVPPARAPWEWIIAVPHGVYAMATRWGKYMGVLPEGLHVLPPWCRVSWVVTQQHIPFDYPVKGCPTLDNVYIKLDILTVFHIVDPERFIMNIGPYKLQNVMASFLEETIRSLARSVSYDEAWDLRGKSLDDMQRSLNDKLTSFGAAVSVITITNVSLPPDLAQSMQNTTSFESKQREQRKNQEYQRMMIADGEELKQLETNRRNELLRETESWKKERLTLSKEVSELEALTEKRLKEINAEEVAEVARIQAQGQLEEARLVGLKEAELRVSMANALKEAALREAEEKAYVLNKKMEAERVVAENRSKALLLCADAEEKASARLKPKREFEREHRRNAIVEALAKNEKAVISGSSDFDRTAQLSSLGSNVFAIEGIRKAESQARK